MENRKPLSSGRWLWMLLGTLVLILALVMALNALADPYGAFGDKLLHWWSYDETLNPRMSKISYLEQHHDQYDSYIIGPSGSSSYPVEELNTYLDASFFNCFYYGTDMQACEEIANYLLDNYTVKNLLLNLSPRIAVVSGSDKTTDLSSTQHCLVDGSSPLRFYSKYLLINPMDSIEKLRRYWSDPYLQQPYRCFQAETGAYDKSTRDAEPIGDLEDYLSRDRYAVFRDYPDGNASMPYLDEGIASVARIVEKCDQMGVNLIVTCQPYYWESLNHLSQEDLSVFRSALASVTDYWDFTLSSISYEPRYFYDETHFRNDVGTMALARIFHNDSVYVPEDFGEYVAQGSQPGPYTGQAADPAEYTVQIPILLYHHLVEDDPQNNDQLTVSRFREHMTALKQAGYTAISFQQLRSYVVSGGELPEKPFLITFDDGYLSNYELAYPILQECGFHATIYVIGVSVNKDTYKDTGVSMTPHFSLEQAAEMEASGLITIGSHGYDLHEVEGRDPSPIRKGILQREDEPESDYVAFLQDDCRKMTELLQDGSELFAYPYGYYSELSEVFLRNNGVWSTVTTVPKVNVVIRGLKQSLRQLGRYSITESMTAEDVLSIVACG